MQQEIIDLQEQASGNAKDLSDALSCLESLCSFIKPDNENQTPVTYIEIAGLLTLLHKASVNIQNDIDLSIKKNHQLRKNTNTVNPKGF